MRFPWRLLVFWLGEGAAKAVVCLDGGVEEWPPNRLSRAGKVPLEEAWLNLLLYQQFEKAKTLPNPVRKGWKEVYTFNSPPLHSFQTEDTFPDLLNADATGLEMPMGPGSWHRAAAAITWASR